jgi:hypothetical protein
LALIGAGLAAAFAIGAPTTQAAAPPHWYLQESGSWVSLSGLTGLVEQMTPETLSGEGELAVYTENEPHGEKPVSNCLAKDTESIEDPSEATLPGTGSMEAFEVICEKGTGSLNAAYPTPCLYGEGFELKGVDLNWPSVLESGTKAKAKSRATSGSTGFDSVGSARLEVFCLHTREHAEYEGFLRPEVLVGRVRFIKASTGEFVEPASGAHFYFKGTVFVEPTNFKDVRVTPEG